MLTAADIEYLKNKHRGGLNNFKGSSYENLYVIYKMATLLKTLPPEDYKNVSFTAQVENAFVDDLLIIDPSAKMDYHQIKNVQSLTWQSGSSHTIEYDFEKQKKFSEYKEESFSLNLIYSDESSKITPMPNGIKDCSNTHHFPHYESLNRLIMESEDFKNAIQNISALSKPKFDQLNNLATILLGIWESQDKVNIKLSSIVESVQNLPLTGNNFIFDAKLKIDVNAKAIYDNIPHFKYMSIGNSFYWSYKETMEGEFHKTSYLEFEKAVLEFRPTIFSELESLM